MKTEIDPLLLPVPEDPLLRPAPEAAAPVNPESDSLIQQKQQEKLTKMAPNTLSTR